MMNASQLLIILAARWRAVVLSALLGLGLAILWVLLGSGKYTSQAQVLVDVRAPATVQMTGDAGVTPQLAPDYLSTQVDVIRSQRVALAAVDKLGIVEDPDSMEAFRKSGQTGDARSYFATLLANQVKVIPAPSQSRVVSISYTAKTPAAAQHIAEAFAEAYRDVSIQLQREPAQQAEDDYRNRVAALGAQLAEAQTTLSAKRAELGITADSPQTPDAEEQKLSALSQQLAMAKAVQATQNQRVAADALPDALASPVVQSLQSEIARVEAQRTQLATFAGPNNVDYKQLTERLNGLHAELAKQRSLVAQGAAATSNQASATVKQIEGSIAAQRGQVIGSQRARGGILALEANVSNLKATYDALVARQAQNSLLGSTDQSNVVVLAPADLPTGPAGLPRPLKIAAGLLIGTLIGVMLAIASELADHRLRWPDDAPTWLGIPDLGAVRAPVIESRTRLLLGSATRYLPRPSDRRE